MINYLIQKDYSRNDCIKKNKSYLVSSLKFLKATKKEEKKYLYIINSKHNEKSPTSALCCTGHAADRTERLDLVEENPKQLKKLVE